MLFAEGKKDQDLSDLAIKVKSLGLEKPVEFLIESHHPLANIAYHLALLVEPILSPFMKISRIGNYASLISDEKAREEFLLKLRSANN
jgi:hypothetical protein